MTAQAIYDDWRRYNDWMRAGWDDLSGSDRQMLENIVERAREAGAAEEREACAQLAKSLRLTGPNLAPAMADYIAAAIRARAT